MKVNRRNFLSKSALLGGVSFAGYVLGKNSVLTKPAVAEKSTDTSHSNSGYQETEHNRHYYRSAKF